jgi:hypothetical protein
MTRIKIGIWNLDFTWNLVFVAWNLGVELGAKRGCCCRQRWPRNKYTIEIEGLRKEKRETMEIDR